MSIPPSIAATDTAAWSTPEAKETTAGPGQKQRYFCRLRRPSFIM